MWWNGLVGGFIGAAAGSIDSSLALMIIEPTKFDLGDNLMNTLQAAGTIGFLTGLKTAFAYLKNCPLPPDDYPPPPPPMNPISFRRD